MTIYSNDDIDIRVVSSWTDTSNVVDHVAAITMFCRSMIMSDSEALRESQPERLQARIVDKIDKEVGLAVGVDYIFEDGALTPTAETSNPNYQNNTTLTSLATPVLLKFKNAETFTLFKLKYYG